MIRCMAVEDEPFALALLADNIAKIPYLECVAKCANAFEALKAFNANAPVDLIFLDINLPGLTGIEFIKGLQTAQPMVVFVTAYEKFAVEGFTLNALDYLLKPVAFDRFLQACEKAKSALEAKAARNGLAAQEAGREEAAFFVNADYSLVKIIVADVTHVEGMKEYLKIYISGQPKPVITRMNFKSMEEKLPAARFLRVHKSFIVNLDKIKSIRNGVVFIDKHEIPVSENMKEALMKSLGI